MPCSVTQPEPRVIFSTVILLSPVYLKGQYQGAGNHKQLFCECCIPSDVPAFPHFSSQRNLLSAVVLLGKMNKGLLVATQDCALW